jgi:Fe-S-cluster-containing hydrogenase component 2
LNIENELCIGCGNCIHYCPVEAIKLEDKKAVVDLRKCVECGTCVRADPCPVNALSMSLLFDKNREISHYLSDPTVTKKATGVPGRGTEEVKTNDVTGRIKKGEVGVCIEMGRPGISTSFGDVEKFTKALASLDVQFEEKNPVSALINIGTGELLNCELHETRVLSCIIEFMARIEKVHEILNIIRDVEKKIDTVFSLGIICRFSDDGSIPLIKILESENINVRPNSKVNVGLGKPLSEV